ncbi:gliding motility lipoprotein GldB [Xanthocytophaga agilis]|uniref:Gliding motility lipoprotein GldB n=1 Tax=Xanthocytophaga agilis TaxID=3048010 RepID=A0AAE3UH47_9BACT|nr:gliding motility lipoprotein GldB [Xanthocytophaga agilis]MDJ1503971.1 gliding motility lipoprotein GldB [Xanthocytophaga agilis]
MNDRKLLKSIIAVLFLLAACTSKEVSPIVIERLDAEMINLKTRAEIQHFLDKNRNLKEIFFLSETDMPDSVLVDRIYQTVTNPAFQKFYNELNKNAGDLGEVKTQFAEAFSQVQKLYPDFKPPKVKTVISGLGHFSRDAAALSVSDSLIVISLDFYAGEKATFVPSVPNFLLKKYTLEALVPSIMSVLAEKFIVTNTEDKSLLNEMIIAAKKLEFTHEVMPETPDSLIIFYTEKQLKDAEEHKNVIWAHFVKEKLLYETNHFKKVKYIGDRPYTAEIGTDCPGAIGRWLGWQIVKKYLDENSEVTLSSLLSNPDSQNIFMKSKFKGE